MKNRKSPIVALVKKMGQDCNNYDRDNENDR